MAKKLRDFLKYNKGFLLLSTVYILWALAFIYHASYVAIDGRRYFNLFDKAMISMRYAWNFAHGHGLVWNVGQRVEGYSNLLMTLIMSLAALIFDKRYAVLAIQLTGVVFMLGTASFALQIFRVLIRHSHGAGQPVFVFHGHLKDALSALFRPRFSEYILFALILFYYPLNYWSLLGMETGLLALLLGAGVLCSILYAEQLDENYLWLMILCFGLAYLTCNASLFFAAWAFLFFMWILRTGRRAVIVFFVSGLAYGLFPIGQTIFRYFYYGRILPNTYTLQLVGMPFMERLANGWRFVQPFLSESGFILVFAIVGLLFTLVRYFLAFKSIALHASHLFLPFYLFGFLLISLAYQIYVGGDPWNYWRIMAPTMPLIFVLFVYACDEILGLISIRPLQLTYILLLVVLALAGTYMAEARFLPELSLRDLPFDNAVAHKHVDVAIALNALTDSDATMGVFWAGTLPYYLDRTAVDFLGNSDPHIANLPPDISGKIAWLGMDSVPGHNKYDLTYSIEALLPTYVEDFHWGRQDISDWGNEHYVLVRYRKIRLYLLRDSPHVKWDQVQ